MTYRDHYYESIRMPINQYQQLSLFQRRKHLAQLLTLLSHPRLPALPNSKTGASVPTSRRRGREEIEIGGILILPLW